MAKCDCCGKGVTFGIKVSHSHRRANRAWKPNVKRVKAVVDGSPRYIHACTRCLRSGKLPALSDSEQLHPAHPCAGIFCYTMTPQSGLNKTAPAAVLHGSMFSKLCAPAQGRVPCTRVGFDAHQRAQQNRTCAVLHVHIFKALWPKQGGAHARPRKRQL